MALFEPKTLALTNRKHWHYLNRGNHTRKPNEGWTVSDLRTVAFTPGDTVRQSYIIPNVFDWPVTPYAGGDEVNKSDYAFRIKVEEYIEKDQ